MREADAKRKAIWGIAPFENATKPDPWFSKQLIHWLRKEGWEIQAVHVLPITSIHTTQIDDERWVEEARSSAEKIMIQYVTDLGIQDRVSTRVEVSREETQGKLVQRFVSIAEAEGAGMILLTSHGRKGFDRFVAGSFAESVLLQSKVPTLFMSSKAQEIPNQTWRILYPTDLSWNSHAALQLLVGQFTPGNAELVLYCKASDAQFAELAERELQKWKLEVLERGLQCIVRIEQRPGDGNHVSQAILDAADVECAQMIAMSSPGGALSSIFPGKVAREVFRTRKWPVWVCGPEVLLRLQLGQGHPPLRASPNLDAPTQP